MFYIKCTQKLQSLILLPPQIVLSPASSEHPIFIMAFITTLPLSQIPSKHSSITPLRSPLRHVKPLRPGPRMDAVGKGIYAPTTSPSSTRVIIFGATGYIGRYVVFEFLRQGYETIAFARSKSGVGGKNTELKVREDFSDATVVFGDVTKPQDVANVFNTPTNTVATVVVSCLASRTGGIEDSNRIDYAATRTVLEEGRKAGANHFVLLSAICVQKPLLEFQRAKLKLEGVIKDFAEEDENFSYSIVRPTAFFKSLAGQVERVKKGSAFVMFGEGDLCKCNALSERDLARFMELCVRDVNKRNKILPVGGPGEAVTPKEQAEILFEILDKKPKFWKLPIGLMDGAIGLLDGLASFLPGLKDAAEFGKIGKYYAVEDMVGPSFGEDTLKEFFEKAVQDGGMEGQDLGDAAVLK